MSEPTATLLQPGDPMPDFDLAATGGRRARSAELRGRPFVLYLYPKADTSGCTREAQDFEALAGSDVPVIGVSRDPLPALEKFAAKAGLTFMLASDADGALVEALGSWVEKSMYGRTYMGIDRSTFLVDAHGRIVQVWRKVKVPGHAAAVMQAV